MSSGRSPQLDTDGQAGLAIFFVAFWILVGLAFVLGAIYLIDAIVRARRAAAELRKANPFGGRSDP